VPLKVSVLLFDFYFIIELQAFNNSTTLCKKIVIVYLLYLHIYFFFYEYVYVYVFSLIKIVISDLNFF
jgi:hypothetical protein